MLFRSRQSPSNRKRWLLLAGLGGATVAFFFDPARGRGRRAKTRDQIAGRFRRSRRKIGRVGRWVGAEVEGKKQKIAHMMPEQRAYDDVTLAQKVQSELFADPDIPKGELNINVEDGTVVLRGRADTPEMIEAIKRRVSKIQGVSGVKSLLHLPNTLAPNKASTN